MNPFTYVKTHWHAMAVGAIAWHFVGGWVTGQIQGLAGSAKQGS